MLLPRLRLLSILASLSLASSLVAQQANPAPAQTPASQQPAAASPEGAGGQAPSAPTTANTITRNVRLVVLDAVVLDKQGNQITDLKDSDFHVTEDGEAQTLRNFDPPGKYDVPPDADIESTADLDRVAPRTPVNIILLDEFNTHFEDMAFARYCLKKWLEKQPGKLSSPTMLIAVSLDKFAVLRDYTQNKDEIIQALEHHFAVYPWQVHQFSWVPERYSTALISLRRVAEATIGHPGHKTMIWLGRGFPTFNRVNFSTDQNRLVNNAVQQTINQLRDARVTLYTIDPAGVMVDPGSYGWAAAAFAPFGGDPDFQELAKATGGRNLYGRNDVDAEIGTSIRDGASFYSLSYRPTNPDSDALQFRRIKVTVDRPGLTVVTRQGYYPDLRPARPTQDGKATRNLQAELGGAANSNMVYDAVPFSVKPIDGDPGKVQFTVDGSGLSWYFATPDKPRHTRLIIVLTYFDKKGKEIKQDSKLLDFSAPQGSSPTGRIEHTLTFGFAVIPPDPKAVRARFVVRVEASGRMGTVDMDINNGVLEGGSVASSATAAAASPATTTR